LEWGSGAKCYTKVIKGRDLYWIRPDGARHGATIMD